MLSVFVAIGGVILLTVGLTACILKGNKKLWSITFFTFGSGLIGGLIYTKIAKLPIQDVIIPGVYLLRIGLVLAILVFWGVTVILFDFVYPPCGKCLLRAKLSFRSAEKYGDPFPIREDAFSETLECSQQIVCSTCGHLFSETYVYHSTREKQKNLFK